MFIYEHYRSLSDTNDGFNNYQIKKMKVHGEELEVAREKITRP